MEEYSYLTKGNPLRLIVVAITVSMIFFLSGILIDIIRYKCFEKLKLKRRIINIEEIINKRFFGGKKCRINIV
ncbi:hypothetical protein GCM10008903_05300 [Clostridium cadaveris]